MRESTETYEEEDSQSRDSTLEKQISLQIIQRQHLLQKTDIDKHESFLGIPQSEEDKEEEDEEAKMPDEIVNINVLMPFPPQKREGIGS